LKETIGYVSSVTQIPLEMNFIISYNVDTLNKTGKTVVNAAPNSEVNLKDTFTSHIDQKIFLAFLLTPYLYTLD
jgi:hypothetical protein